VDYLDSRIFAVFTKGGDADATDKYLGLQSITQAR
jgi:hypothetical protein